MTIYLSFDKRIKSIADWAIEFGVRYDAFYQKFREGRLTAFTHVANPPSLREVQRLFKGQLTPKKERLHQLSCRLMSQKKRYDRALKSRRARFHRKLADRLRQRMCKAVHRGTRGGSAVRDLGCSIAEFTTYIEALFLPGMTWENWGISGWHFDHRVPLARFDLSDRKQFLEAAHFSNYQPLWALDNVRKGAT